MNAGAGSGAYPTNEHSTMYQSNDGCRASADSETIISPGMAGAIQFLMEPDPGSHGSDEDTE